MISSIPDVSVISITAVIRDVIWSGSPDMSKIDFVNPAFEQLWGRTPEELYESAQVLFDGIHPDDRDQVRAVLQENLDAEWIVRCRLVRPDGSEIRIEAHGFAPVEERRHGVCRDITEPVTRQRELEDNLKLSAEMGRTAKIGGWDLDAETSQVNWTDQVFEIFEMPVAAAPPLDGAINLYHPDDREIISAAVQEARENGTPYDLELRVQTAKGNEIHVRTMGRAEVENGRTVKLWGTLQDITARKVAEAERSHMSRLISEMSQLTKTGVWEYIFETGAVTFSDELNRIFEIPDGEPPPPFEDQLSLHNPADHPVIREAFQRAIKHGEPYDLELRVITTKGNHRWVHTIGRPEVVDGKTVRLWGSMQDITQRRLNEEALAKSEIRRSTVVGAAPDSIVLLDQAGIVEEWNHAAEVMFGYSAEEAIGNAVADLIIPEKYRSAHTKGLAEFALTGDGPAFGSMIEVEALRADGSTVPIELAIQGSEDGGKKFAVGIMRDVSERVDNERRLLMVFEQLVGAMARTVENRDPYTAGHQMRVRDLSVALAEQLGFSPDEIRGITYGAMIHDIGKMAVPAEILNRPGKLSTLEFEMIKSHPVVGAEIISDVAFPWPVGSVVLQHHERLDGSGYPYGLKAGEISNEAQIVAVADVVEAMSSHRPYRAALGIDAALAEISKGRGITFDTDAVDACIGLFRDGQFTFDN